MSKASRDKGSRVERELAAALTKHGIPTRRVIGSGAHGRIDERLRGDLQVGTYEDGQWMLTAEVKARKNGEGFKTLEGWLGDNEMLLLRRNNADPIAVLHWSVLLPLLELFYEDEEKHHRVNEPLLPSKMLPLYALPEEK